MKTVAVVSQKGGVGKTTAAIQIGFAAHQSGLVTVIIDLDPQGHLSHIFGAQARHADDSVYGFFIQNKALADIACITKSGVVLVPSHMELSKLDALLGKGVNIVTRLRFALHAKDALPGPIVIDCNPLLNVLSLNAVFAADLVLIPVSADYLSLKSAGQVERALNALEPVFKQRIPRRYLLTRYDRRRRMSGAIAGKMAELMRPEEICTTKIREAVRLAESPAVGLDIFRHAPASRGAEDYAALCEELVGSGFLN